MKQVGGWFRAACCCGAVLWAMAPGPAAAETLQCAGGSIAEGDSRMAVAYKCGAPLMQDTGCAPVYMRPQPWSYPPGYVYGAVPCLPTEDWLYDRGPGNLMATVRFVSGAVQSISYGRGPR